MRILKQSENISFNLIALRDELNGIDRVIDVLLLATGLKINEANRLSIKTVVAGLPKEATMKELIDAINTHGAEQLGISRPAYDEIIPFIEALTALSQTGKYGELFNHTEKIIFPG